MVYIVYLHMSYIGRKLNKEPSSEITKKKKEEHWKNRKSHSLFMENIENTRKADVWKIDFNYDMMQLCKDIDKAKPINIMIFQVLITILKILIEIV